MAVALTPPARALGLLGLATAAVYGGSALFFGWRPPENLGWRGDLVSWLTAVGLAALYLVGDRIVSRAGPSLGARTVVVPLLPVIMTAALTMPRQSSDGFLYAAMAHATSQHGLNPYADVLHDIPNATGDPGLGSPWMDLDLNPWLHLPLVYGFLFADLLWLIGWIANGDWWAALVLLKLINAAAYLMTAGGIWLWVRRRGRDPTRALYLFMWSPLVLFHELGNAHNDLLMAGLILGALYLVAHERFFWVSPVLVMAALIKYLAVGLVPFALYLTVRRRGWAQAAASAVVSVGVGLAAGMPYLNRLGEFRFSLIFAQMSDLTTGSPANVLFYSYRALGRLGTSPQSMEAFASASQAALGVVAVLVLGRILWGFLKSGLSAEDTARAWLGSLLVVVCFASPKFYAWYICTLLPLALVLGVGETARELTLMLSVTHMASLTGIRLRAIGYFVLTTGGALVWWWKTRRFGPEVSPPAGPEL